MLQGIPCEYSRCGPSSDIVPPHGIRRCCMQQPSAGGFHWEVEKHYYKFLPRCTCSHAAATAADSAARIPSACRFARQLKSSSTGVTCTCGSICFRMQPWAQAGGMRRSSRCLTHAVGEQCQHRQQLQEYVQSQVVEQAQAYLEERCAPI